MPGQADACSGVIRKPKMTLDNPYNCLVLFTRCESVCPSGAITLPSRDAFEHFVGYVD
jgi:hypothetical protein